MAAPSSTEAGVQVSGGVTVPYLNYHIPTASLIVFALLVIFVLHMLGARFMFAVGAGINAR